jgi:hypothetical protein
MPTGTTAPGADDNGSGTAAVIEAARIFTQYNSRYTIIYALWDEEEQGLIGSAYYAQQAAIAGDSIMGVINLDMIAWDNDYDGVGEIHIRNYANSTSLKDIMVQVNTTYSIGITPSIINPGTTASDQASFWNNGYGALLLIEEYYGSDFNAYYHTTNDLLTHFNQPYYHKMSKLALGTVATLAELEATSTFALTVSIADGWNMVSIPGLHPVNQNVNTWWAYRDMGANVFKFLGGYQSVTTAAPGIGYWMKHSGARTYNTGDEWPAVGIQIVPHDPIAAATGWNLIGGYENSAATAGLTTTPPGLIDGPVYKYSGGYLVATTLDPGYGYWIKLTGAGQIILPEGLAKGEEVVEWFKEDWGRIILTNAEGNSYTLYAVKGDSPDGGARVDLSQYELPPAPMAGMFDIRYSSGRVAEDLNSAMQTIDMSGITYPLTVRVEGMDIRLMDETGKNVNVNLKAGEDVVISDVTIQKLMVSGELIPAKYALEQNYPNPFNPSTVIEFSLPENVGNVKLSIYNTLGEKVAELVNTSLMAGKYSYQWNAKNVATGIYIYELRTDKFVAVKKMILLR